MPQAAADIVSAHPVILSLKLTWEVGSNWRSWLSVKRVAHALYRWWATALGRKHGCYESG